MTKERFLMLADQIEEAGQRARGRWEEAHAPKAAQTIDGMTLAAVAAQLGTFPGFLRLTNGLFPNEEVYCQIEYEDLAALFRATANAT